MNSVITSVILAFIVALPLNADALSAKEYVKKPKLVVFLIFDQLRADLFTRYYAESPQKPTSGFKQLVENGAWFSNAEYQLLQNMTGPGHATLLSGSYPYRSGIALNNWYDTEKKSSVYCTQDDSFHWLSDEMKKGVGTSPANLLGSNLPDEFKNAYPKSRVVSISLKDRAAILMGGHRADISIWMDPTRFLWTSSDYYFPEGKLPNWIEKENVHLEKIKDLRVHKLTSPLLATLPSDFPQNLVWKDKSAMASPAGLELTERLALSALETLSLGQKGQTDFLLVSFSSHDYAGHTFGPQSNAMTEMLKAEDAVVGRILAQVKKSQKGMMKDVLVVLSSDHGVAPNPEWAKTNHLGGGRLEEEALAKRLEEAMREKYGTNVDRWVLKVNEVNFYLNKAAAQKKNIDFAELQAFAKSVLLKDPTIAQAFTEAEVLNRKLPAGIFERQILNSYFPGRSGHIVGILRPFNISSDHTANHETGYSYDRTVPLILMGRNIKPGVYSTQAEISDLAPTIAHLLGILAPSNSHGRVLHEIISR